MSDDKPVETPAPLPDLWKCLQCSADVIEDAMLRAERDQLRTDLALAQRRADGEAVRAAEAEEQLGAWTKRTDAAEAACRATIKRAQVAEERVADLMAGQANDDRDHREMVAKLAAANEENARLKAEISRLNLVVTQACDGEGAARGRNMMLLAKMGRAVAALQVCARVARYERRLCTRRDAVMGDCIEWRKHTPTHELCNHCEESNAVLPILADADSKAAGEAWAAQQAVINAADEWTANCEDDTCDQPLIDSVFAWRQLAAVDARRASAAVECGHRSANGIVCNLPIGHGGNHERLCI